MAIRIPARPGLLHLATKVRGVRGHTRGLQTRGPEVVFQLCKLGIRLHEFLRRNDRVGAGSIWGRGSRSLPRSLPRILRCVLDLRRRAGAIGPAPRAARCARAADWSSVASCCLVSRVRDAPAPSTAVYVRTLSCSSCCARAITSSRPSGYYHPVRLLTPSLLRLLGFPSRPCTDDDGRRAKRGLLGSYVPSVRDVALDPGGATGPRISVPHMLPSTPLTVSASAKSPFRGSLPLSTRSLCRLRRSRHRTRRNTRYQAGATPYLGRTFTGWTTPAFLAHQWLAYAFP